MKLSEVELNRTCIVRNINIKKEKTKFRIMELGIIKDCEIVVKKKSALKKTLLIIFCFSCFTLKENIANEIEVEYA